MSFKTKRKALKLRRLLGDDTERETKVIKNNPASARLAARQMKFARTIGRRHALLRAV